MRNLTYRATTTRTKFSILILAAGLITLPAIAQDRQQSTKRVEHQINVADQTELEVRSGVGHIEIRYADQPFISVDVEFEGKSSGFMRRKSDVSAADIDIKETRDSIELRFSEDNISANWVITAPAFERSRIDLGVGSIQSNYFTGDMSIKLGVGDIDASLDSTQLSQLQAAVGVGAVNVVNIPNWLSERHLVSEKGSAKGPGEHSFSIEVGVGDIHFRHEAPNL